MSKEVFDSRSMQRTLTNRFAIAMTIIGLTISVSVAAVFAQLQKIERDARLINLSGRQRMLSQRIAMLSIQAWRNTEHKVTPGTPSLEECIRTMSESHRLLSADSQRSSLRGELFHGPDGIDQMVRLYLSSAEMIARRQGTEQDLVLIQAMATQGTLLKKLDDVVAAYEEEQNYRRTGWFRMFEMTLLAISVITIAAVFWFVFRPAVKLVSSNLSSLERSNLELTEFSYRISHDLRAPVVSSLGIVDVAQDALNQHDLETVQTATSHIRNSLSQLSATIESISNLVKQRMLDAPTEAFSLSLLVKESLESVKYLPGIENVDVKIECPESLMIHAKRVHVKQAVENLLSNAVKYHDPKAKKSLVLISVTGDRTHCQITVSDNGLGIHESCRDRIFSMFQRFHPGVSFGSGLGLYLVKQSAYSLNGTIEYSPREKGSTFKFCFPATGA